MRYVAHRPARLRQNARMSRPVAQAPAHPDLAAPELFLSRELAALEFNFRVLAMARDETVPPPELLASIRSRVLELVAEQYAIWRDELGPQLDAERIHVLTRKQWSPRQRRWLQGYFEHEVLPVLSPLGLDPAHPF